jgi:tRNA dimethylallyltransferase
MTNFRGRKTTRNADPGTQPKIIVIVGPTASGKTALAIRLAKKYSGEIVSADSRQVYRGMDIGSGKATRREQREAPHHLIDVASPKRTFTAADFRALGRRAIAQILRRGKTPIICGGTGFYIDALLADAPLPDIPPDPRLRKKMDSLSTRELFALLREQDPRRAETIDPENPRRLVRALEIVTATGKPVAPRAAKQNEYRTLFIGLRPDPATLGRKIHVRLLARLRQGMIAEVRRLHNAGVSWKRLDDFGLEYRFVSRYLRGTMDKKEMTAELERSIRHYAKRQITWWKRNKAIHWMTDGAGTEKLVAAFLSPAQEAAPENRDGKNYKKRRPTKSGAAR